MDPKNRTSRTQTTPEENIEELQMTRRIYRCNYRDVKDRYKPAVQYISADSIYTAVEIFIADRRNEGWEPVEIFVDSLLLVIDERAQIQYVLNEFGEPELYESMIPDEP